jgi:hypothetical protein
VTDSLLDFLLDGPGKERLVIDADGTATYLVLDAAHPDWASGAGVFRVQLSAAETENAATIAQDLVDEAPKARGRTGPVVTASVAAKDVTHPLAETSGAAALLSHVIERVRSRPLAVVSFTAEALNGADVRLAFENVGTIDLDLLVARESCRVDVPSGDTWTTHWHSTTSTRLALVAAPQGFLDGVNSMATLEPGTIARAMLPGALSGADTPGQAAVELRGWLDLAGLLPESGTTDPLEDPLPGRWPFRLRSPVFGYG